MPNERKKVGDPLKCADCGATFPTGSALGGHRKIHNPAARDGTPMSGHRKPHAGVKDRPAAPAHFESLLARLKAKRDELDAAILTLEKIEELLA